MLEPRAWRASSICWNPSIPPEQMPRVLCWLKNAVKLCWFFSCFMTLISIRKCWKEVISFVNKTTCQSSVNVCYECNLESFSFETCKKFLLLKSWKKYRQPKFSYSFSNFLPRVLICQLLQVVYLLFTMEISCLFMCQLTVSCLFTTKIALSVITTEYNSAAPSINLLSVCVQNYFCHDHL